MKQQNSKTSASNTTSSQDKQCKDTSRAVKQQSQNKQGYSSAKQSKKDSFDSLF